MEPLDAMRLLQTGVVRAMRLAAGVTLADAARGVGVDYVTAWRWESGRTAPHPLLALAYLSEVQRDRA